MITVIPSPNPVQPPCVVREVARRGLSVQGKTYCGGTANVANGVLQIPASSKVCSRCETAVLALGGAS